MGGSSSSSSSMSWDNLLSKAKSGNLPADLFKGKVFFVYKHPDKEKLETFISTCGGEVRSRVATIQNIYRIVIGEELPRVTGSPLLFSYRWIMDSVVSRTLQDENNYILKEKGERGEEDKEEQKNESSEEEIDDEEEDDEEEEEEEEEVKFNIVAEVHSVPEQPTTPVRAEEEEEYTPFKTSSKKRGRPSNQSLARKRKEKEEKEEKEKKEKEEKEKEEEKEGPVEADVDSPSRRKRGRPRKTPKKEQDTPKTSGRGRGRPRKVVEIDAEPIVLLEEFDGEHLPSTQKNLLRVLSASKSVSRTPAQERRPPLKNSSVRKRLNVDLDKTPQEHVEHLARETGLSESIVLHALIVHNGDTARAREYLEGSLNTEPWTLKEDILIEQGNTKRLKQMRSDKEIRERCEFLASLVD